VVVLARRGSEERVMFQETGKVEWIAADVVRAIAKKQPETFEEVSCR